MKKNYLIKNFGTDPLFYLQSGMIKKQWSQRQLAEVSGIDETILSKMLKGKKTITFKSALLIGAALDLDPVRLVIVAKEDQKRIDEVKKKAAKLAV